MFKTEKYSKTEFKKILLHEISEKIFDFIAVVRVKDRKIVFVNEMGAKLFGYENSDDLLDWDTSELGKRIPVQKLLKQMDKKIISKKYLSDEIELITGKDKSFRGYIHLTPFAAGGDDYCMVQIEKADLIKLHTEDLIREKQRFGALMDYASIGVIILNSEFRIVLMNNSILHLFGYEKKELMGINIEALIPSSPQQKYKLHLLNYFSKSQNLSTEFRMELNAVTKRGKKFPVEISIGRYRTSNENFAILFINDISIRKKGEEEIRNLNARLEMKVKERTDELDETIKRLEEQIKETEKTKAELVKVTQYQKAVLISSGAMIIATDQDGIITLFNKAAEDSLGYKADEVIGKFTPTLFHDSEETKKIALKYSEELEKEITPGFEVYVAKSRKSLPNKNEWTYVKKNGTRFPVSLSITSFRNRKNEITGFLGVAVDISETKKTEEELKKALAREIELNEMKSRFVSIASHEFRTPLSTVLSSTYLLQKYMQTDEQPKREKHISRIVSSVSLLTDMLDELLNVGKIEEGKVSPKYSHLPIKEHIERVIEEIKGILKKGQLISYNHFVPDEARLDSGMLTHIVINLLSNAIKFSPEETSISIESKISGKLCELRVKDHGIGISKEDQQHLFERFYRSRHAADVQGTGLGLYIVQKYTELMNGKVECRSELGKGTEFLIKIEMGGL